MTVSTDRASTEPAATNGITRAWGFDFRIDAKEDARLVLLDALDSETYIDESLWDFATDTVAESGSITYPRAPVAVLPATGDGSGRIRIDRVPALKQTTDLKSQGAYRANDVERMADKIVWQVQALSEEKTRLKARIEAAIAAVAALGSIDIGTLGDLQALVDTALEAATGATASAVTASDGADSADASAIAAAAAAAAVEALGLLVDLMVNGLPGQEYAAGKTSALDKLTSMDALMALAPTTQVITIGDHTGEAVAAQVFTGVAAWKGAVVMVVRAAASTCTLKFPPGMHLKAPDAGYDASVAIVRVINYCGAGGTVTLEGPADPDDSGDIVVKPTPIAQKTETSYHLSDANAAVNIDITLVVPAGTNRRFVAYCSSTHVTTPTNPTMAEFTSGKTSNITVRDTDGTGLCTGSDPILARVWTGDMATDAEATTTWRFAIPANRGSAVVRVVVYKDASGYEDYDVFCRTAAGTSEDFTSTPSVAGSAIDMMSVHQGADALTGMTVGAGEDLQVGKTGGVRALRDLSYATNYDLDVAASLQTKTGASAKTGPGAVMGVCFLPVTTTGGGGGDDQMYGVGSKTLARYEQADVMLHSSGTVAFYTRDT